MTLDLDHFRTELENERQRLVAALETVNHKESLVDETGDLSTGPDHLGDQATETFLRELDGGLEENADHLLSEIEAALGRIEKGTYGVCVTCGKPIATERLEAVPYAARCVEDTRALENGS
jgi:RNA polymerase-binding protein DksA